MLMIGPEYKVSFLLGRLSVFVVFLVVVFVGLPLGQASGFRFQVSAGRGEEETGRWTRTHRLASSQEPASVSNVD